MTFDEPVEPSYSPGHLAAENQLSTKTVKRLFANEPGIIMIRAHITGNNKKPRYMMRIPHSVAVRVFRRLRVKP